MSSILITGGTGSLGQQLVRQLLAKRVRVDVTPLGASEPRYLDGDGWAYSRICVYSRDEMKQSGMRLNGFVDSRLRYFIGDVRDRARLARALVGVTHVIHAAALKQVDSCQYNPTETLATNVDGTANVIEAALDRDVAKVLLVGTDKAVDPINTYGTSKALAEDLIVDANSYGGDTTTFAATRYGNVITSRGAVLPLFQSQHFRGRKLTITDPKMTRFVLTLNQAASFVLAALQRMAAGEVYVPRLPTVDVATIADSVSWPYPARLEISGRRPGEKRHELLVSEHEAHRCHATPAGFVILPGGESSGRGEAYGSNVAEGLVDRLDVAGFRELAGLGPTLAKATA